MSAAIGFVIALLLALLGAAFGGVRLPLASWTLLLLVLTAGGVPFCALGCALGYIAGPNSAPPLANLLYLPMSLASGLWIPIEFMPAFVRDIAPLMPPYHLARLALATVGGATPVLEHIVALVVFTLLFLALAVAAYQRDEGRTWG
jgi:ABC-2 type transport system permease protein